MRPTRNRFIAHDGRDVGQLVKLQANPDIESVMGRRIDEPTRKYLARYLSALAEWIDGFRERG